MASYLCKYRSVTSTAGDHWMSLGQSNRQEQLKGSWQTKQHSNKLTKYLQVLSGNNPKYGSLLLKTVLKSNKQLQDSMSSDESVTNVILRSIKSLLCTCKTDERRTREEKEAMVAVLTACTYNLDSQTNKNNICKAIGVCKETFYCHQKSLSHNNQQEGSAGKYTHTKQVRKESLKAKMQRQCVLDFSHSDKSSCIDSNCHQVVEVVGHDGCTKKHAECVWSSLTVDQ